MDFKKYKLNKKVMAICGMVFIAIILVYINHVKNNESKGAIIEPIVNKINDDKNVDEVEALENICVHVSGQVNNPGIVILEDKSRVIDAIEAAGGITQSADISCVNLAYVVTDGIKIYIPSTKDIKDGKLEYLSVGGGENIIEETNIEENKSDQRVNINTATKAELESLTGIGHSTADRIIEFRKVNGKFKVIDDIKNVTGIGNSKFEAIKNNIIVK